MHGLKSCDRYAFAEDKNKFFLFFIDQIARNRKKKGGWDWVGIKLMLKKVGIGMFELIICGISGCITHGLI